MSNTGQFAKLCSKFKFNTELINFWLNDAVLQKDTGQYPSRIVSNSWNLAAGKDVVGFSGTKDNHRLLPFPLKQNEPQIPKLLGADAKMIHTLLSQIVHTLESGYVALITAAASFDALIDKGSLLAGRPMDEVAKLLLGKCKHQGVIFFKDEWNVLDGRTGVIVARKYSPLKDAECFIIFDDAMSRGTDTKMAQDVKALSTLGHGLARHELVQGAGRLRMLGKNQTLVMAGTSDVLRGMNEPKEALEWVLRNTAIQTEQGYSEWYSQGCQFRSGKTIIDENWTLDWLYGKAEVEESLALLAKRAWTESTKETVEYCEEECMNILVRINQGNEECERELQVEEERETQVQIVEEVLCAAVEKTWDYTSVLRVSSASLVATECYPLSKTLPVELCWEHCKVFVTKNFRNTCNQNNIDRLVRMTMRRAWGMVRFKNEILLLSEMEANGICKDVKFCSTVSVKNTCVELYNGETNFNDKQDLKRFIKGEKELKNIIRTRGLWNNWNCSDLEAACEERKEG